MGLPHVDVLRERLEWLEELSGTRAAVITKKDEEIRALKERLEQCEADYKRCFELNERMAHEVHDLKAELLEARAFQELRLLEAERLKKSLEQCELLAQKAGALGLARKIADAARAALEGK